MRDYESYLEDCRESDNCIRDSRGIKGKTSLSELKYFKNPVWSTNKDYMHSVLEGVIKRFFKAWFEDTVEKTIEDEYNYSLKPYITLISNRLLKIKPPSFIPVCLRSIMEYNHCQKPATDTALFRMRINTLLPDDSEWTTSQEIVNNNKNLVLACQGIIYH